MLKLLNLFSGVGGNTYLLNRNIYKITHVELDRERCEQCKIINQNDTVINGDAMQFLLDHYQEYDIIWASPPCPTYSHLWNTWKYRRPPQFVDPKLFQIIQFMHDYDVRNYIVENVVTRFRLHIPPSAKIHRHYFWSDRPLPQFRIKKYTVEFQRLTDDQLREYFNMIDFRDLNIETQTLRNILHPLIGKRLIESLTKQKLTLEEFIS